MTDRAYAGLQKTFFANNKTFFTKIAISKNVCVADHAAMKSKLPMDFKDKNHLALDLIHAKSC